MIRLIIIFALFFLLAGVAAWVAGTPGGVTIHFADYLIDAEPTLVLAVLGGVFALGAGLVFVVGWLRRDMPFFGKNAAIRRQGRGLALLNKSLVALAGGDTRLARRLAEEAEALLPPQPMVHLINAEAALRDGDGAEADKRFKILATMKDGRFLGLRGMVDLARRSGDDVRALKAVRAAFDENPRSPWVIRTLFALEVAAGHWAEAGAALSKAEKHKLLDANLIARHRGALAFAEGLEMQLAGSADGAKKQFNKALKHRPDFAPAVAALARLEQAAGRKRAAEKLILKAWSSGPHPAVLRAYKALDTSETDADWLTRAEKLYKAAPEHPYTLDIVAEAAVAAHAYDRAKEVLRAREQFAKTKLTAKTEIELARRLAQPTRDFEAALADAAPNPHWHCSDCHAALEAWQALCPHCHAFDSLDWVQTPSHSHTATPQIVDRTSPMPLTMLGLEAAGASYGHGYKAPAASESSGQKD